MVIKESPSGAEMKTLDEIDIFRPTFFEFDRKAQDARRESGCHVSESILSSQSLQTIGSYYGLTCLSLSPHLH